MTDRVVRLGTDTPVVAGSAWVAPNATLVGKVHLDEEVSIWYAAVLRGDGDHIRIGARSNLQDATVVHADPGFPVTVGAGVSVGHRAILHGCTIEDDVLIGMGAIVMNGAQIGRGSLVAAGALVVEGTQVPPGSLVAGVPGKIRRATTEQEKLGILGTAHTYTELMARHASAQE
jgi:carbonic anhydrase/acetyltransferase-like protein (isoleucine patch superfamily)